MTRAKAADMRIVLLTEPEIQVIVQLIGSHLADQMYQRKGGDRQLMKQVVKELEDVRERRI